MKEARKTLYKRYGGLGQFHPLLSMPSISEKFLPNLTLSDTYSIKHTEIRKPITVWSTKPELRQIYIRPRTVNTTAFFKKKNNRKPPISCMRRNDRSYWYIGALMYLFMSYSTNFLKVS